MPDQDTLKEELEYFNSIKSDLLKTNDGQFVLIKGQEMIGCFPTTEKAYDEGIRKLGNVAFLIKEVRKEETIHTQPALNSFLLNAGF